MITDSIAFQPSERKTQGRALSKKMFAELVVLLDVSFVVASACLIKFAYVDSGGRQAILDGHLNYLAIMALVTTALFLALQRGGQYNFSGSNGLFPEIARLVMAVVFSFGSALLVAFLLKESDQFSRVWMLSWCATIFLYLLGGRLFWLRLFGRLSRAGYFTRRVYLIGGGDALQKTRESLALDRAAAEVVCISDLGLESEHPSHHTINHIASAALAHAVAKGQSGAIDEMIVALPLSEGALLDHVIRRLKLLPVEIKVAVDFNGYGGRFTELSQVGATSLATVQKKPISEWNVLLKACEDYVIAVLALFVFLPAMAAIALAIKLDSGGPVLFRQRRHGFNHRVFSVYKFRTMTVAQDGEEVTQARRADPRVTRVGRILRKTSLDELPQLLNVLSGDMSLVGPRPHALVHNDHYSRLLENYASRHRVKPGLTGWAQINGWRGETSTPEAMEQRVRHDLEYIDNWSIWFDLKILFLTPIFGFASRSAY
jgi:putative colanic acid biosysnthesis UDP-glucose lipid carrier transferase